MIAPAKLLLLVLGSALVLATPAWAESSFLVFKCEYPSAAPHASDGELCRVGANGRGERAITSDGNRDGLAYLQPALSRDGQRLTYTFGVNEWPLFTAGPDASNRRPLPTSDVRHSAVSADGGRIAYVEMVESLPGEPDHHTPVLHTIDSDGTDKVVWARGFNYPSWWGNDVVAVPGGEDGGERVCLLAPGTGECRRTLVSLPGRVLTHPAVSPNGKFLAVRVDVTTAADREDGIFIFSTSTGSRVGVVTRNSGADRPAWSPDGQAIAFSDTGLIHTVPRGRPEAIQLLGHGNYPAWGGPAGSGPSRLELSSISIRGRRIVARGTLAPGARERLHVSFTGHTYAGYGRFWWPKPDKAGRVTIAHTIKRGDERERYLYGCRLVVTYPGDSTHLRSTVYRTPRQGVCKDPRR